jgi:translation elongation factor EF-1alpha
MGVLIMVEKKPIGAITHYFNKIGVAVIELKGKINVGDKISIEGATSNISQKVDSMQIEHESVKTAGKGQSIGLKVVDRVREGDEVFLVK